MSPFHSFLAIILVLSSVCAALAGPFTPGSILVSSDGTVYEMTPSGGLLRTLPLPKLDDDARDIIWNPNGRLHVFNGTFDPLMSTYDPITGSWLHRAFEGWSTVNNGSYGGIATDGRFVYVSDNVTAHDGAPTGVVRFDLQGGPTVRSAAGPHAFDLTLGLDGLLYVLDGTGSPSGRSIKVFDRKTLSQLREVSIMHISSGNRGLAVDIDGSFFIATWGGELVHTDPHGVELKRIPLPTANPRLPANNNHDVDIRLNGDILVGHRFGSVVMTDREFSSVSAFLAPPEEDTFVAFTDYFMPAAPSLGDLNRDGGLSEGDGMRFVQILRQPDAYLMGHPDLNTGDLATLADFDGDGMLTPGDTRIYLDSLGHRSAGYLAVDQADADPLLGDGDGNFFGVTLATGKAYQPGDARGDVAATPGRAAITGHDGVIDATDLDYALREIGSASPDGRLDLNDDGDVDMTDFRELLEDILGALRGDATLDLTVNQDDLEILVERFGDTTGGWLRADFNGDNHVDFGDLALLAPHFGQSTGTSHLAPQAERHSLPEPSTAAVFMTCMLLAASHGKGSRLEWNKGVV